jgi:hypothetical protein
MHRDKRQKERKQNDFHGSVKKKAVRPATTNHGWESKELVVREFGAPSFTHTSRTEPTRDVNDIRLFVVSLIVQYRACMMLSSPSGMMGVVVKSVWLKSGGGVSTFQRTLFIGGMATQRKVGPGFHSCKTDLALQLPVASTVSLRPPRYGYECTF